MSFCTRHDKHYNGKTKRQKGIAFIDCFNKQIGHSKYLHNILTSVFVEGNNENNNHDRQHLRLLA